MQKMGKRGRPLRKHSPRDQPSVRNLRPRGKQISPHRIQSEIPQDESLPTERSLQIDESMLHYLDSVAAAPEHVRPRRVLNEDTDVSSIAMKSGLTKYLDQTYQLRSAKKSQNSVSAGSSLIEQSGNLEEMLKSPDKQPHFLRLRKNVIPKDVDAEVFGAAFTSPEAQISATSLSQPKRVGEISVEGLEETSPILSQPFKRRRNVKVNPSAFEEAFEDVVSPINSMQDVTDGLKPMAILSGPSSHSGEKDRRKMSNSAKRGQSTSNRSMNPQDVPWFRQWQEKAAAAGKTCGFNLLPREERRAKLEELITDLKRKHDETLKVDLMKRPFVSKPDEPEKVILPVNKKKVARKPSRPDLLVNGKAYRPRLRRPKSWATPRLYKLIIPKCEKKYGIMKARRKAEEFVIFLCEKVSTVMRRKKYKNYEGILEEVKRALYELGVINCLMDYFVFIEDYLPFEYRIKAIPCLRAYGQRTGPPLTPGIDLFADLGY